MGTQTFTFSRHIPKVNIRTRSNLGFSVLSNDILTWIQKDLLHFFKCLRVLIGRHSSHKSSSRTGKSIWSHVLIELKYYTNTEHCNQWIKSALLFKLLEVIMYRKDTYIVLFTSQQQVTWHTADLFLIWTQPEMNKITDKETAAVWKLVDLRIIGESWLNQVQSLEKMKSAQRDLV